MSVTYYKIQPEMVKTTFIYKLSIILQNCSNSIELFFT